MSFTDTPLSTAKDFAPIQTDYTFFEDHSTEAEADIVAYLPHLQAFLSGDSPVRVLDIGCAEGRFTAGLLTALALNPDRLKLTLVEPVSAYLQAAVSALQPFSTSPIIPLPAMPHSVVESYDLVLSNHALYYIPDLQTTVTSIMQALAPGGLFLAALAGRRNLLVQLWYTCYGMLGKAMPYHIAESLDDVLVDLRLDHEKEAVSYTMAFPDTVPNRASILRFLMGTDFADLPKAEALALFDPHKVGDEIRAEILHEHFLLRRPTP